MSEKQLIKTMHELLASTYHLYLTTQNYHWNVTGSEFYAYHGMFETQYNELADAIDEIAERIRSLGEKTKASFQNFLDHSHLKEPIEKGNSQAMLKSLIAGHETVIELLKKLIEITNKLGDDTTNDFVVTRCESHEKTLWMLKSSLA